MIKNFKNWLIKQLGGYTTKDMVMEYHKGRKSAAADIKDHADHIYGVSANEWANDVYHCICNIYLTNYCAEDER